MTYNGIAGTLGKNGTYVGTDATPPFLSVLGCLTLGTANYSPAFLNGHIRKFSYYPVALSSSKLVALTS
jgi:hypothetical protein